QTRGVPVEIAAGGGERFEDLRQLAVWDPYAGIGDAEGQRRTVSPRRQRQEPAVRREADCIGQQIGERALQPDGVGYQSRQGGWGLDAQSQLPVHQPRDAANLETYEEGAHIERLTV